MKTQITIAFASAILLIAGTSSPGFSQFVSNKKLPNSNECPKEGAKNKHCSIIKNVTKTIYNQQASCKFND